MVVQRTPRAEAVRPTRRAISPRLAMRTDVIGLAVEIWRVWPWAFWEMRSRARWTALDLVADEVSMLIEVGIENHRGHKAWSIVNQWTPSGSQISSRY